MYHVIVTWGWLSHSPRFIWDYVNNYNTRGIHSIVGRAWACDSYMLRHAQLTIGCRMCLASLTSADSVANLSRWCTLFPVASPLSLVLTQQWVHHALATRIAAFVHTPFAFLAAPGAVELRLWLTTSSILLSPPLEPQFSLVYVCSAFMAIA